MASTYQHPTFGGAPVLSEEIPQRLPHKENAATDSGIIVLIVYEVILLCLSDNHMYHLSPTEVQERYWRESVSADQICV